MGDNTLSNKLINRIIKSNNHKKWPKLKNAPSTLWFLMLLRSRKTSGETVSAAYIKEALAKSLAIFKPKRLGLSLQDLFLS